MILYESTVLNYLNDSKRRVITDFLLDEYQYRVSQKASPLLKLLWKNTIDVFTNIIREAGINEDCGIRIDFVLLPNINRLEFIITGRDLSKDNVFVLEILPWENLRLSEIDDYVVYDNIEGESVQGLHPFFLAASYISYLKKNYSGINPGACIYLPECKKDKNSLDVEKKYKALTDNFPIFYGDDREKVIDKLRGFSNNDSGIEILERLHIADHLSPEGIDAFLNDKISERENNILIYEQKYVLSSIIQKYDNSEQNIIIVDGAPGSGKTKMAISAIGYLQNQGARVGFLSPYSLQCSILRNTIDDSVQKVYINSLSDFCNNDSDKYDVVFVDETQDISPATVQGFNTCDIFEKIIKASDIVVFMYRTSQIHMEGIVSKSEIKQFAEKHGRKNMFLRLDMHHIYNGRGNGIKWLAYHFQFMDFPYYDDWNKDDFIIESVKSFDELTKKLSSVGKSHRLLVNYIGNDKLKEDPDTGRRSYYLPNEDIYIPVSSNSLGLIEDNNTALGVEQIQGIETDYIGLIVGNELSYDEDSGTVVLNTEYESSSTAESSLWYIKQRYLVLMSRGIYGIFLYIQDEKLRNYFEDRLRYSIKRFELIKETANKYDESKQTEYISNIDDVRGINHSYITHIYPELNKFVIHLKKSIEDKLDESDYKMISDTISAYLLEKQKESLEYEDIKKRYVDYIVKKWEKLRGIKYVKAVSSV